MGYNAHPAFVAQGIFCEAGGGGGGYNAHPAFVAQGMFWEAGLGYNAHPAFVAQGIFCEAGGGGGTMLTLRLSPFVSVQYLWNLTRLA